MSREKLIIAFTVLVDVIGIGIVIPVLPFYVESFGVSSFAVTLLFAVFSLFSFISAPFLGSLSDKLGRRPILIVSIISTSVGWFVFAGAGNAFFLFLGRIIDGIAAGNFSTAQSALSDIAKNTKERTANLGLIGAIFGVGLILGPMLGGLLSSISPAFPFWIVGFLAALNAILAFFILPETNKNLNKNKKIEFNPLLPIFRALKNRELLPSFLAWFLFGLAAVGMHSIFALYLGDVFGLGSFAAGIIFTGVGVVIALNQGIALKHFWLKKFREKDLEIWMMVAFGLGFLLISFKFFTLFIIGLAFTTFGQSVLRVVMTSRIAGQAKEDNRGEILGILSAVASLGMIIAPIISGYFYKFRPNLPFLLSAGYILVALLVVCFSYKKRKEGALPEDFQIPSGI